MTNKAKQRFFYGYVIMAAGFGIWLVGWGTHTSAFGVFFRPLLDAFGWTRADTALPCSLSFIAISVMGIVLSGLLRPVKEMARNS